MTLKDRNGRVALQFCGFGGQGIVLSSIIFGAAAVIGADLYAVQTQSYGSEARGGECQAELILASEPVGSPVSDQVDILVAMSQMAYNRYATRLKDGGILVVDPDMVAYKLNTRFRVFEVPASRLAEEIGSKISANMIMLGFLQELTGLIAEKHLLEAIRSNVPKYLETNLRAAQKGREWAKKQEAVGEGFTDASL